MCTDLSALWCLMQTVLRAGLSVFLCNNIFMQKKPLKLFGTLRRDFFFVPPIYNVHAFDGKFVFSTSSGSFDHVIILSSGQFLTHGHAISCKKKRFCNYPEKGKLLK